MKQIGIALLLLLASGCATGEKKEAPVSATSEPPTHHLDLLAVQHDLGMDPSPSFVGYKEKRFDACRMKEDLSHISDCSRAYFIQVGIQLSCRPTEEAQNNTLDPGDLTPAGNRDLRWQLSPTSGQFRTDVDGHGIILAITAHSMKKQYLRISTGEDFLITKAREATQIVTPVSWCK
jgi:hypothetical protein